jgi:NADH-quinone oxidoreductase subunit N
LAYSSIAQAGYILMALVPYGDPEVSADSAASALFYLVAYALTNFAAWAVVIALEQREEKGLELSDYAGLGRKHPALAAAATVAMLSSGVPRRSALSSTYLSQAHRRRYIGWSIGVLTSLVSAYYYLRVVVIMYMQEGEPAVRRENWLYATAFVSAIAVVLLSVFAAPLISLATQAVIQLL